MSRTLKSSVEASVLARIDALLDALAAEHGVTIPWAIESGSRAWGFPSPDSDYDCRFVFVRPLDQVLSPWPRRDVIEAPPDALLDVNGWDLAKAVRLLLKGNAVVIEWLMSPIVYRGDARFRADLLALARQAAPRRLVGRHYLHLGERQRRTYFGDGKDVPQKKIFYALRPAAALRWLRLNPDDTLAPMHFPTLLAESDIPADVAGLTADLMDRKAVTRELGSEPLPAPIAAFIDAEFELARREFEGDPEPARPEFKAVAERFFRDTVLRFSACG